jgi:hypothetical protein
LVSGQGTDTSANAAGFFHWGTSSIPMMRRAATFYALEPKRRRRALDARAFIMRFLGDDGPPEFTFRPGGQFIATASCIGCRPRAFYEQALQLAVEFPDAAHCFERMWPLVFGVKILT